MFFKIFLALVYFFIYFQKLILVFSDNILLLKWFSCWPKSTEPIPKTLALMVYGSGPSFTIVYVSFPWLIICSSSGILSQSFVPVFSFFSLVFFYGRVKLLFVCYVCPGMKSQGSFLTLSFSQYLLWLLLRAVMWAPLLASGLVGQSWWCNWLLTREGSADPPFIPKGGIRDYWYATAPYANPHFQGQSCKTVKQ